MSFIKRRRLPLLVAVALVAGAVVAPTVIGALTTTTGGATTQFLAKQDDQANTYTQGTYATLPGAVISVTVPAGQTRLIVARFSGASRCEGSINLGSRCLVRIMAGSTELLPVTGTQGAFDTTMKPTSSSGESDGTEAHAIERSRRLGPGTHTLLVQRRRSAPGTSFTLASWHFSVEVHQ